VRTISDVPAQLVLQDIDPLARYSVEVTFPINADALKDGIHKDRVRMVTFENSAHGASPHYNSSPSFLMEMSFLMRWIRSSL
jgi:hypothetical protein